MAYRYEIIPSAAKDLLKLTRRNHPMLLALVTAHIPTILEDPYKAGEAKKGDLAGLRAYNFRMSNVAYRLVYQIEGDVVVFIAIGPHDAAYERAGRRT